MRVCVNSVSMKTSVSLNQELSAYVEGISEAAGDNDAEAIRDAVRRARDLDGRVDDLEAERDGLVEEVADLRAEVDRLEGADDRADELGDRVEELEATVADLETDLERVQNEKQQILAQRDENKELRRYVEDKRSVAQAEQQYRQASILTRAKWKITGMPSGEEGD